MDRKGLINGKCSPWCAIKEKLDTLWDRTHNAFTSLNGTAADGTGNLQIEAGTGITLQQTGNRIEIGTDESVPYTGTAPIVIDPETREVSLRMDSEPVNGSSNAVTSDGVYDAVATERSARTAADTAETSARIAADNALGARIDNADDAIAAETSARTAAVSSEQSARISADNALGARIDRVIDGTTPPATISGVLPITNGGTGRSDGTWYATTSATNNLSTRNTNFTRDQINSGYGVDSRWQILDSNGNQALLLIRAHDAVAKTGWLTILYDTNNQASLFVAINPTSGQAQLRMQKIFNGISTFSTVATI